ncbi:hypothetical protein NQ318_019456 [Aromia moschata]|uniref:Small subunit processome component 20 homolog n=1 Tax=Aromia moschata TaxID=1265417 RepID=A0AAV8XAV1_9CUCU|nr:hypothetical protein NQ318_019456 [Aromia moschata]
MSDWSKYAIDFKEGNRYISDKLLNNVRKGDLNGIMDNSDDYYCSIICIPHLNIKGDRNEAVEIMKRNITVLVEKIVVTAVKEEVIKALFLLNGTVETLVHLSGTDALSESFNGLINCLLNLTTYPDHILSLKTISLCLTLLQNNPSTITMELLVTINNNLENNFNSPFHEVRLLTSHIYSMFENLSDFKLRHSEDPDVVPEDWKVFSICYNTESIEPHVHTYRDQLQNLEKLSFDKPQMLMCNQTAFRTVPLRYLCGTLFINFRLLWEPVIKIIESHAHGLEINTFWNVFKAELKNACENVRQRKEISIPLIETKCQFLCDLFESSHKLEAIPDFSNYRILLWKAASTFADVAEAKTRDVSELFLNFIGSEFLNTNSEGTFICSIKKNAVREDEVEEEAEKRSTVPKSGSKVRLRTLLQKLKVFSQILSPMSMYREPELHKIYFDLLQHKDASIQKAALDCIMTYKYKYLTPYKEHLYNLVDDKNFKHEIVTFRIDKDTDMISPEHRENLMPFVMQIVFSKMNAKTGLRTGGKSSGQLRRNLILRFMAGCQENEMLSFIRKAFRFYNDFLNDDPEEMVSSASKSINFEKFIPPKKLQSTLNLLNVVLEQFGGLMGSELLTYLLQILLIIGAIVKETCHQTEQIHVGYLTLLKNLRMSCIKMVERFFGHFEDYPWSNKQINAIFTVFVWPYLNRLTTEGIHSPTTLLKLIVQWGSNPRYFPLLVKHEEGNTDQYILPHVVRLLVVEKSHSTVVNAIEEMLENLLSLQLDEEDTRPAIPVDNLLSIKNDILSRIGVSEKLNYGSCILLPHVPIVLSKIKRKLEGKAKNLNQKELFILSRVSELVWEADISDAILHLLLPVFLQKCKSSAGEEIITRFLTTIKNLIRNVEKPQIHLKEISPLFSEVSFPSCRKILTQILEIIAQSDGILLINNLHFLLRSEKDLSLKENSAHTLKLLCPMLINKYQNIYKDVDYILNVTIFVLIRNGMRSGNVDVRNESIALLGHLARDCPESHFILRDLHNYANKTDLEVDFFENLTHLQIHRHARALLKFCQITRELETVPNPRTLTQFILPLATHYLCSEKYTNKNSVVDAAIEVVSVVCRILPWHQYEGVLKYYLSKLRYKVEYQKQLVRLIVVILDAFHFDLSKGHLDESATDGAVSATTDKGTQKTQEEEGGGESANEVDGDGKENEVVDFGEVLDDEEAGGDVEDDEDNVETSLTCLKICEKISVLCKSTAVRVIRTIQTVLLPQLHKSLAELTHHDTSHKVNRKRTGFEREEEDLLRVPISLALVKLLQRLPTKILESNLPGCLKGMYQEGDIDKVLLSVLDLCRADLFGSLSEEKEIVKITVKVSEAKSTKSYDTLHILSQFITESCLMDLILPIKRVLDSSHSFKAVQKAQESLRHITLGLVDNSYISVESLLKFAYGSASESIPQLAAKQKKTLDEKGREKLKREREDCFIIPKVPGNRTAYREQNVRTSMRTNTHLLVEFGLGLCYIMLKRDKLRDGDYKPFIDPFVVIFKRCLKSKHVKLSTLTLQCLSWTMKYDLPSMRESIKSITKDIFGILHKYASAGLSKGDNFDLVMAAFKAMAVLVRDVKYHTVDTNQLKILLLYVEQDMHDHNRQATAFNLLKSIISRKLIVPEMNEVMEKVAELSITSELSHVREQSRIVFHQFLMDYPLGNTLEKHLGFYISQLSYEFQYGRESAIEMIQTLINTFPLNVLKTHSGTLLITLGARLVNDETPECRKMVADCLSSMLNKLPKTDRDPLFEIIMDWLKDANVSHRRLAAQLCGIFVSVEKSNFEARLKPLTPLIMKQFGLDNYPGKFVKLNKEKEHKDTEEHQRLSDLLVSNKSLDNGYLYSDPPNALKSLTLDLCDQLQDSVKNDLAEQVIKNLVFVARVLQKVPVKDESNESKLNLLWLAKLMRRIVNKEVVENSSNTILRTEVFKWIAGVGTALEVDSILPVLHHMLAPLVREMITVEEKNAPLRQLAKEVANLLKKKVGVEEYTKTLSKLQQTLSVKRAERKRARTQLAVTDPEMFAKKKIKRHERKKEAKKRKMSELKGTKKNFKRRKVVDLEDNSEII